jgi:ABC-2 type transport system permease protein
MSTSGARIVDRGYQHYAGVRLGLGHAFWTMLRGAILRAMGLRRKLGPVTVLKWLLLLIPYGPVIVFLFLSAGSGAPTPAYPTFYENLGMAYIIFTALVAPDMLCQDRRERVLTLYFAAPITRPLYLLAQWLALTVLLLALTLLPMLVLFAGQAVLSDSVATFLHDRAGDLGRLVLAGGLVGLYYGTFAIAVASFSDRRTYAAGAYVGLLLVTGAAASIVAQGFTFSGHARFALLDLLNLPIRAARWILGEAPESPTVHYVPSVSGWAYVAACLGVTALSLLLAGWRYLRVRDS